MRMQGPLFQIIATGVVVVLMSSCASEQTVTQSKARKDAWGNELPFTMGKDADGNPTMNSDKRSQFENKNSNITKNRDFSGKDYTKKSYRKDRWGGNTAFKSKKYEGNTDANRYKKEPWFVKKQAKSFGTEARANNKKFLVNPFRSQKSSYKHGGRQIAKPESVLERNKRNALGQPTITNWKDQKGLSVKDTNGMLGR